MTTSYIATTRSRDLQALGTGGQLAIEAAGALAALLTRELSPAHAALFAEPHPNPVRGEVDWYAEGDGAAVPLADVAEPARATTQGDLDRLVADIRALSVRLQAAQRESDRFLGEMLALALELPDAASIRVRDGRPVLVAWGHVQAHQQAGTQQLLGRALRPAAPPPIRPPPPLPPPITRSRSPWLWLAALVGACVVLLLALLLLADPFRWRVAEGGQCRIDPAELAALHAYATEQERGATLRAALAGAVQQAGTQRLACPPAHGSAGTTPVPGTNPPANGASDVQRAAQRGAHGGRLQVVLAWEDRNDLDLHVRCPDGEELNFNNRQACGGVLDLDANAHVNDLTDRPVENASWAEPPAGHYQVVVVPYDMRAGPRSAFRVTIRQDGHPDKVVSGTAEKGVAGGVVADIQVPPP